MQLPISHTYYQLTMSNGVNSAPYKIYTYPSPDPHYMYTTNQNYSLGATLPKHKMKYKTCNAGQEAAGTAGRQKRNC